MSPQKGGGCAIGREAVALRASRRKFTVERCSGFRCSTDENRAAGGFLRRERFCGGVGQVSRPECGEVIRLPQHNVAGRGRIRMDMGTGFVLDDRMVFAAGIFGCERDAGDRDSGVISLLVAISSSC